MDDPSEFTNEPIDATGLPQLAAVSFRSLDPAYARLRATIAGVFAGIVVTTTVLSFARWSSWWPVAIGGAALAVVLLVAVAQRVEVAHMGYLVREQDVSFRSGVISRSMATVPFARVQHVSIGRGPAERQFGLATLQLRTAGGQIAIPGLPAEVAERLKQLVADKAGSLADAEVDEAVDGSVGGGFVGR
ncbi:MAG: PH domain-containing protein [Ilumatobacter sp.]|nr:PH domain-containing protein [Ilumatobacter sp.]